MVYSETHQIESLHPSLPGHFPGNPIVPGVLILQRVLKAAANSFGAAVAEVTVAKFHARLKPDEQFNVVLERSAKDAVHFRVLRGDTLISGGILKLAGGRAESPESLQ
jgi:3-hydroxymyristoyl/3-hydroxydecanoyl-(acyl carrier protein) dehydratase